MSENISHDDFLKNMIFHHFTWPLCRNLSDLSYFLSQESFFKLVINLTSEMIFLLEI